MHCARCGRPIDVAEGKHAVLWGENDDGVTVAFLCSECSNAPEFVEIDPLAQES